MSPADRRRKLPFILGVRQFCKHKISVPVYVTIGGTKSRDDSYADLCHQLLETSIVDIVAAETPGAIPDYFVCTPYGVPSDGNDRE
jgi:hypothetical protein